MTIIERISKLEKDITTDINMGEKFGWMQYESYILENMRKLDLLKKANKIHNKWTAIDDEDI